MLPSARAGRFLCRSLRLASLSSKPSIRSSPFFVRASISTRPFSAFSSLRHQAAAYQEEEVRHAPPELTKFSELAEHGIIDRRVIDNITRMNIHTMTDVQRMTINECLDGSDLIGQAKTGTGKTIAFLMPIIQRMMRDPAVTNRWERPDASDIRALIISPTRELAEQIAVEAQKITAGTRLRVQTAVGGTQKRFHLQKMQREGCHLLIGTPGRVQDLLSDPYSGVKLDNISTFVMDEADRLLDIGFAPAIQEIQSYMPPREQSNRQTLMFSATVPKTVVTLVRQTLKPDFKFVRTIDPDEAPVHEAIPQKMVFLPGLQNQIPVIVELAMRATEAHKQDPENNMPFKAIVFANSQNEVALIKAVLDNLRPVDQTENGPRSVFASHPLAPCRIFEMYSKLTQQQRNANTEGFRRATSAILCSSDVAARGMDFPNVSHVIQIGMPRAHDDYIHRVGRTGRAGKKGEGWLLLHDGDQRAWQREFGRDLKLQTDESLETAKLDMTQKAQIPPAIARIMQMVGNSFRTVSYGMKAQTYLSLLGSLRQSPSKLSTQKIVDQVNELSRYGWSLESPPAISAALANKLGFNGCDGLEIGNDRSSDFDRGSSRGGFGGNGRSRGFDRNDPFGQGMGSGRGVSRGFGGDRGGFGGDRRGGGGDRFGDDRRGGFSRDSRGGFGRRDDFSER